MDGGGGARGRLGSGDFVACLDIVGLQVLDQMLSQDGQRTGEVGPGHKEERGAGEDYCTVSCFCQQPTSLRCTIISTSSRTVVRLSLTQFLE